jgi:signal transduction histidine kinase
VTEDRPDLPRSVVEESAEDLYEHAPCGYVSTLPDGTIARINQTFVEWTGHRRHDLLSGTRLQQLLTIGSRIYYETHLAPLLQMQGFAKEIALEVRCADGRALPVVASSIQTRADDGTVRFTRTTLFDSTDRRRYEHELLIARRRAEQAAKDKADLLAMLSHDIRNPLNAVMGVVQLLERSELNDRQRRHVELLKSSSQNILTLLKRVLQLSEAESGAFVLHETPFSIATLVDDVVALFCTAAEEKGLKLAGAIEPQVPGLVIGDATAFRQVLNNLVGNAIKFTDSGQITISVRLAELTINAATLDVAVIDTGIGIAADRVERIFDEFTQASYETRMLFGGTGLGLSIARKLLALYNSRIRVTSVVGEGSTFAFSIRLPLPPAE